MARIEPVQPDELAPSVRIAFERHAEGYNGALTNTKRTLGHSLPAFEVYMQWYSLFESVEKILGKRLAYLYAYTISSASTCTICAAFFRKKIVDAGENPDDLLLTASQKSIIDFGCSIARHHGNIADHIYNEVAKQYNAADVVTLIAFAGQMIATTIFNNVVETDIDDYLVGYVPPVKYY